MAEMRKQSKIEYRIASITNSGSKLVCAIFLIQLLEAYFKKARSQIFKTEGKQMPDRK